MGNTIRILHLEDDDFDAELIQRALRKAEIKYEYRHVQNEAALSEGLASFRPDIVLSDFDLPALDGLTAIGLIHQHDPNLPVVIVTGALGDENAVRVLKAGAKDYVLKDRLARLAPAINRALEEADEILEKRRLEQSKHESEQRMRSLLNSTAEGIYGLDKEGLCTFANDACIRLLGYRSGAELLGRNMHELIHHTGEDSQPNPVEDCPIIQSFRAGERVHVTGDIFWRADGNSFPVEYRSYPVRHGDVVEGAVVSFLDITERLSQEQKVARLQRIRMLLGAINSTIVRGGSQQDLFRNACEIAVREGGFNMAWIGLLQDDGGLKAEAMAGDFKGYLHDPLGDVPEAAALKMSEPLVFNDIANNTLLKGRGEVALSRGFQSMASCQLKYDGKVLGVFSFYSSEPGVFDREEVALLKELVSDVSYSITFIRQSEKLDYLAYYDPLTQLANRRLFIERLDVLLESKRQNGGRLALLALDLDRFKAVNDSLGNPGGDEVLKEVARRLSQVTGTDEHIARVAGDRFALIVPDLKDTADLADILQARIWPLMAQPIVVDNRELTISIKVGIAVFPDSGEDGEGLYRHAEAALKRAKEQNERYTFYSDHMTQDLQQRFNLESSLRKAQEKGEFLPYYQAKVDLSTGKICGAEALMRWNSTEHGLVPPTDFIPLLEATGQILEAGAGMLQNVLADRKGWLAAGLDPPRVAVNVSPLQLRQADFVDVVRELIYTPEDGSAGIDLEVTESMLMDDIADGIIKLKSLREMGFHIAIDDFGTGYSSLAYLARLPIDTVKIDRSFIISMIESEDMRSIVSAIIALTHSLGHKVVAEGVASDEQLKLLRELNCDEIQGYLYSEPLPAEAFADLLKRDVGLQ